MQQGAAGQPEQRSPLDDLVLDRRLDDLAARVAERPDLGRPIAEAKSTEALRQTFAAVAEDVGIDFVPEALAEHLALLLRVEPAYYHVKPSVGFDLAELPWHLRLQVGLAFVASRLAIPFDTPPPFGRPLGWLLRLFPRSRTPTEPGLVDDVDDESLDWIRSYNEAEQADMRVRFDGLGSETWRLHIDWEDQDYGAEVYDLAKHGRQAEDPGYLECALASHRRAANMLGRRLTADAVEVLQRVGMAHNLRRGRAIAVAYHARPRDLWRLRELSEPGALDEVAPRHLRQFKHRRYEAIAFDYLVARDRDAFERDNPVIAAIVRRKYGGWPKITARFLDAEFLRFEVCYFDRPFDRQMIKDALDARFDAFYRRMDELDRARADRVAAVGLPAGQPALDLERIVDDQLMEIARLVKWLEYCRPFYDGNTRNNILILNKLLVEYGFVPTVLAQRNDAPFFTDEGWCDYIREGMRRWHLLLSLKRMALLDPILALRATVEVDPGSDYARTFRRPTSAS